MLCVLPSDWSSCVQLARVKFEKYFNHKVESIYMYMYVHDIVEFEYTLFIRAN